MNDPFQYHASGLESPASRHIAITPSDSADLAVLPRALYCATGGTVMIRDAAGVDLSYPVAAGQILPIRAHRIMATGTTATVYGWL